MYRVERKCPIHFARQLWCYEWTDLKNFWWKKFYDIQNHNFIEYIFCETYHFISFVFAIQLSQFSIAQSLPAHSKVIVVKGVNFNQAMNLKFYENQNYYKSSHATLIKFAKHFRIIILQNILNFERNWTIVNQRIPWFPKNIECAKFNFLKLNICHIFYHKSILIKDKQFQFWI